MTGTKGPETLKFDAEAPMPSLVDNVTNEEDLESSPTYENGDEVMKNESCLSKTGQGVAAFYWKNEFLVLIILVILLAKAYPPLGGIYFAPKITATWIAVMFIFLLAGLNLKTEEFSKAFQRVYFNAFVFVFSFGVDSAIVFGISRLLVTYDIINLDLANGMVIAACLPLTINMCVVLTQQSGGDEASAIFNSAFGNLVGVFLSPALILGYIGVKGEVSVATVFYKLAIRVLLPIIVGQLLKFFCPPVNAFVKKYKPYLKKGQMYALVFIVYTVFCRTFLDDSNDIPVKDIFIMIAFIALSLTILMFLAWYALRILFKNEIRLRVMGLYGCTHKTVAMGIPLINAIYDGNPAIGFYTLPLLIWHPMQLIIGTFLAPRMLAWVATFDLGDDDDSKEPSKPKKGLDENDKGTNPGKSSDDNTGGEPATSQSKITAAESMEVSC